MPHVFIQVPLTVTQEAAQALTFSKEVQVRIKEETL